MGNGKLELPQSQAIVIFILIAQRENHNGCENPYRIYCICYCSILYMIFETTRQNESVFHARERPSHNAPDRFI